MNTIKLALVEDEKIIRDSIETYLADNASIDIRWSAASVEEFLRLLAEAPSDTPDIVLLDIQLPGMSGIEGISWIKTKAPAADIIILTTMEDTDSIFAALREGACSYISKRISLTRIQEAIHVVSQGGSYMSPSIARKLVTQFHAVSAKSDPLTARQRQIVQGIVNGKSYQQLADQLFVSIDTVRSHIKKIYKALEINSKTELIHLSLKGKV